MTGPPPRTLLVGFHSDLNQSAVLLALDKLKEARTPAPFVALCSRSNFLGDRADVFLPDVRGFRDLDWEVSRRWPMPSATLWRSLQPAEAVAMKIMDRTWRVSRAGRGHETRKKTWLQWATYAYGFLAHHGIEKILHCNVPHFGFQYTLFCVARAMGIETRFLMQLQVRDTFILAETVEAPHLATARRLASTEPLPALTSRMEDELARRAGKARPFYMDNEGVPLLTRLHARQKRFFRGRIRSLPAALAYHAARRRRGIRPEKGRPYVYLPLHLQPEATTLPLGGVYQDQSIVIETLVRALPEGWLLVIKENPKQRFDKRQPHFYRSLSAHDSVRLVGRKEDSFALSLAAEAVATVTGTAGWEALCLGRHALLFGPGFYECAAGATRVRCLEDAREALDSIQRGVAETPTPESCRSLLAALQDVSYEGVCDSLYLRDSRTGKERSALACGEAVLAALTDGHAPRAACHA
ncbi:MAG: hypothetical protein ISQ11_07615 [Planctomycetes bacterium]|nr:hypothetical protein [Planctomycetota bacterium]